MKSLIRSWLRLDPETPESRQDALRDVIDALERLEPARARYLAQFAYLLGRVAHADQHVSPEETRTMELLVKKEGDLPAEQAMLVVALAQTSNRLFGGTEDFTVAREFAAAGSYEQRFSLVRCLFAVSSANGRISIAEEREIQRVARELRLEPSDLVTLRLEYKNQLPGLSQPEHE
jgi:uncharacterized tellurite resistance protein B-like protein